MIVCLQLHWGLQAVTIPDRMDEEFFSSIWKHEKQRRPKKCAQWQLADRLLVYKKRQTKQNPFNEYKKYIQWKPFAFISDMWWPTSWSNPLWSLLKYSYQSPIAKKKSNRSRIIQKCWLPLCLHCTITPFQAQIQFRSLLLPWRHLWQQNPPLPKEKNSWSYTAWRTSTGNL